MKKFFKKTPAALLATVLMMTICLAPLMKVAAEETITIGENVGSNVIGKKLNVAKQVETPNATFKFQFVSLGTTEDKEDKVDLQNTKITFSSTKLGTQIEYGSISDILIDAGYNHAGIYVYEVTEVPNLDPKVDGEMEFDDSLYYMYAFVENTDNGGLKISKVLFATSLEKTAEKTNTISFKNTYRKSIGDESDPALLVFKKVEGTYGNKTKLFDFSVTVYPTDANTLDENELCGYLYSDKKPIFGTKNEDDGSLTFNFKLFNEDYFFINKLYVGTTYTVSETKAHGYTTNSALVVGGAQASREIDESAETYTVTNGFIGQRTEESTKNLTMNGVTVENTSNTSPITGIFISNLPFIILIAAAVTGFIAYIASKRFKRV